MKKTVLITGGSRGIGAEMVKIFVHAGYNVVFSYNKSKDKAETLAEEVSKQGGCAIPVCADVSKTLSVTALVGTANIVFGQVDVLINNAGIAQQKLFTDITDEDWRRMIDVNLTGTFNCCRAVLPQMISRKDGCIINISSMWGEVGASCEVHYSASKAGIIGLTKALAKEVGPSNIRVNCISPGVIKTDMLNDFSDEDLNSLAEETPLGRLGTPKDVANAALFLASENASFITGQILGINGGFII